MLRFTVNSRWMECRKKVDLSLSAVVVLYTNIRSRPHRGALKLLVYLEEIWGPVLPNLVRVPMSKYTHQ